jgi:hypothetical protein
VRAFVHAGDPRTQPAGRPGDFAPAAAYIRAIDGTATAEARLSPTAQRAVEAYGGAERWRAATTVSANATFSGVMFRVKSRHPQAGQRITCSVHEPFTRLDPIDSKGNVGVLDGHEVRIERPDGEVIERRPDARTWFPFKHLLVYWDVLDLTYFCGYASWNYFTLPALLLRDDIEWTETGPGELRARFPDYLPTHHAERQRWVFDRESGMIARYDYVPEIVAPPPLPWVANVVVERGSADGFPYEARRRVTIAPSNGTPWKRPEVVAMRVWDYSVS